MIDNAAMGVNTVVTFLSVTVLKEFTARNRILGAILL
jgi:hypothetical protein